MTPKLLLRPLALHHLTWLWAKLTITTWVNSSTPFTSGNWLNFDRDLTTVPADGQEMANVLSQVCKHRCIVVSKSHIYFPRHMMLKWANHLKVFPCFNCYIVGMQRLPKQDHRHCRRGCYGWSNKDWLRAECDYSLKWLAWCVGQLWVRCRSECKSH